MRQLGRKWRRGTCPRLNQLPGFVIIGVHSPEFRHEHEIAYVRGRIDKLSIPYPVVMDNGFRIRTLLTEPAR